MAASLGEMDRLSLQVQSSLFANATMSLVIVFMCWTEI
jgi:hypothetical protein